MIACEEAVARVYEYLDGELDAEWSERVRYHVEVCRKCYPYFNFERIFLDHVRSQHIAPEHSDRLERRIREALRNEDAASA
ncbi:MAG: anti-sigma factor [Gemmatimonadota bacterium]|nr:anti-sigma factor [Gemmatimonadota bacterium]